MLIDPTHVMTSLAAIRPLFHSEADFQHAFAWQVHKVMPDLKVRLEYQAPVEEKIYIDVWLDGGQRTTAIELKYLTKKFQCVHDGERFNLKNQSALDVRRYDILKDVMRIESVKRQMKNVTGCSITLTNDPAYWRPPSRKDVVDAEFRLHEGRTINGTLSWSPKASAGTMKGRMATLELENTYQSTWRPFSQMPDKANGEFRWVCFA